MKRAVSQLLVNLDTMKTNEPINRRAGKIKQADAERQNAKSFEAAIKMLSQKRPMWRAKL